MKKVTEASLSPPKIHWLVEPTYDEDGVQRSAGLDEFGREHGDPVPRDPDVGLSTGRGDTLHETLRALVRDELFRRAVEEEGFETFEESDDFEVEDDMFPIDPHTPYEAVFDPPAPGGGKDHTLAGEVPNGKGGPPEKPPTQPISQKAYEEADVALIPEPTAQKPKGVGIRGEESSVPGGLDQSSGRSKKPSSGYR